MQLYIKVFVVIEVLLIAGLAAFSWSLVRPRGGDVIPIVTPKIVALVLLIPVFGLFGQSTFVFYAYLIGAVALTARTRTELASIYLMMLPMMPEMRQEVSAAGLYLMRFSSVFAVNLGALIGFALTPRGKARSRPLLDLAAVLLVSLFVLIDARDMAGTSFLRSTLEFSLMLGVPYLVVSRGVATRQQFEHVLLRLCLAGVICSVVAIFEEAKHWVLYSTFADALQLPDSGSAVSIRAGRIRVGGPMLDYTSLGAFLAIVLVIMPVIKQRLRSDSFFYCTIIMLLALLATQSRGAWVATIIGYSCTLLYRGLKARAFMVVSVLVLSQIVLTTMIPKSSKAAEAIGIGGASVGTADYRKALLSRGMDLVYRNPVLGQSQKDLVAGLPDLVQGQKMVDFVNTHLFVLMASGGLGFIAWLFIWLLPVMLLLRQKRDSTHGSMDAKGAPFAIIMTSLIVLFFTSWVDRNLIWPTIGLGLVASSVAISVRTSSLADGSRR